MATKNDHIPEPEYGSPPAEPVWEDVRIGLGEVWDWKNGPLDGVYVGRTTIEVPDNNHPGEMRDQTVYQFSVTGDSDADKGAVWALWGNYQLDQAFAGDDAGVHIGNRVRITNLGKTEISGGRSMNRFRIQVANTARQA